MMRRVRLVSVLAVCSVPLLCGFMSQCSVGGFQASDFEQVNVDGFDAEDNAEDGNHYAYGMEYFCADGADEGYLYVGTGNNILELVLYYIETLISGGDILDAPVRPPEILRYRPDLGPKEWETVFDYRDVETDPDFETIGFRFMKVLDAAGDAKNGERSNYLYAATQGAESALWRSSTGDYGDWEKVFAITELGASIRWIEQHDGRIYLAVAYDSFGEVPPPGELWVSDNGLEFEPIMQDGFGDPNNRGVQCLISYNGWLYAGTKNDVDGFQIWKLAGPDKDAAPVLVVDGGGPSAHNENAGTPCIFKGKLYFGTQLYIGGINPTSGNALQGCDIIRIDENDNWETIVGPNSLSGYESGFNHFTNAYQWWMATDTEGEWLYASTFDQGTMLSYMLDDIGGIMESLQELQQKDLMTDLIARLDAWSQLDQLFRWTHAGGDIYRTCDGVHWFAVTLDGMGDPENYGWRTMKATPDGHFYIGSANPASGTEIWRAPASTK